MYAKEFRVEIVTPVEKKFEGTCSEVILPGIEGEMAVLGGHAPLLTMLSPGVTLTLESGKKTLLSTGEGFATIAEDKVVCLVDFAFTADELDFAALRKEKLELMSALQASPGDQELRAKKEQIDAKLKAERYGKS